MGSPLPITQSAPKLLGQLRRTGRAQADRLGISEGSAFLIALCGFIRASSVVIGAVAWLAPRLSNLELYLLLALVALCWPALTAVLAHTIYRWAFNRSRVAP